VEGTRCPRSTGAAPQIRRIPIAIRCMMSEMAAAQGRPPGSSRRISRAEAPHSEQVREDDGGGSAIDVHPRLLP
jgi:hypothetical protein